MYNSPPSCKYSTLYSTPLRRRCYKIVRARVVWYSPTRRDDATGRPAPAGTDEDDGKRSATCCEQRRRRRRRRRRLLSARESSSLPPPPAGPRPVTCMMSGGTSVTSPNDARVHHRPAPGFVKDDQATRAQDGRGRGVECSATERNGPSARGFVPPGRRGWSGGRRRAWSTRPLRDGVRTARSWPRGVQGLVLVVQVCSGHVPPSTTLRPKTERPRPIPGGCPRDGTRKWTRCSAPLRSQTIQMRGDLSPLSFLLGVRGAGSIEG